MLQKPRPSSSSSSSSSGLGCKIVSWVGSGIYTAFFVSLDRCSCVKLDTIDIYEPVREQPLLFHSHRRSTIPIASSQNNPFSRRRPHSKARHSSSTTSKTRKQQVQKDYDEDDEDDEEDAEGNNEEEEAAARSA